MYYKVVFVCEILDMSVSGISDKFTFPMPCDQALNIAKKYAIKICTFSASIYIRKFHN